MYYKKKPIVRDGDARRKFLLRRYNEVAAELYGEETKTIEWAAKLKSVKDQINQRKEENPVAHEVMQFKFKEKDLNSRIVAEHHERQVLVSKIT